VRFELALVSLLAMACDEKPAGPGPERFASVKKATKAAGARFCEKTYPARGEGARTFTPALTRPFEGGAAGPAGGWTWVNLWATWCTPCVEEMGMLNRWRDGFAREGLPVRFELLSIDEPSAQAALEGWKDKNLAGPIRWLRAQEDLGPFLESLGVDRSAAIPVHALVDPQGALRCVRVGSIHQQDYGAVRDLIRGG
jgi:thiol-disulfide isomerase/thioredoxin